MSTPPSTPTPPSIPTPHHVYTPSMPTLHLHYTPIHAYTPSMSTPHLHLHPIYTYTPSTPTPPSTPAHTLSHTRTLIYSCVCTHTCLHLYSALYPHHVHLHHTRLYLHLHISWLRMAMPHEGLTTGFQLHSSAKSWRPCSFSAFLAMPHIYCPMPSPPPWVLWCSAFQKEHPKLGSGSSAHRYPTDLRPGCCWNPWVRPWVASGWSPPSPPEM